MPPALPAFQGKLERFVTPMVAVNGVPAVAREGTALAS